ncbi:4-carboxymuconolactone decarboxylase [Nocardioides sp. J9]|uniref:carboxymuconolactone decarboxylase family protein n=1 Tax=Nocardioides sp. J9 TaxID=935844 RepID=UPI0011AC2209|nr:carboxymuconolactone decarboxylase family protein [Nocardioides sp. J9]TWG98564.1 4-carboxymuconolactone decarboxylase [Nocardioides sp. J9]
MPEPTPAGGLDAAGERIARQLFGDERYERTRTFAPDGYRAALLRLADRVVFGTVYADDTLPLRERSLCTIAVLAALGHEQQLRAHIGGALQVGISEEGIAAVITQVAMYAGYPPALNAMAAAEEVFASWTEGA